ncbi:MAG TPA: amidohydrolase [Thermoanaerobaculia bacterium]|nr:amidohydrolase [Thermoanaerobaculia bacterium]
MKALFIAVVLSLFAPYLRADADLILAGGKVWTGDPARRFAEAVAIAGDRILAVGSSEEMRKLGGPATRVIELDGRLVTPGFIDGHLHFTMGGFGLSRVQLRDASSPEEFARRIGAFAKTLPKGSWILAGDWDHELWTPVRLPDRSMIDALTPDHPVFVSRLDGHMALANSRALALAKITKETPDPEGGTIVRDARGEPTGVLKDAAMDPVWRIVPAPSMEERIAAARAALGEAARLGVTAVNDVSDGDAYDDFRAYQALEREGALTTRIHLYVPIHTWRRLADAGIQSGFGGPRLRIGGLKGFADGSLGSSTAAFFEPYLDTPDTSGLRMPSMADGSMASAIASASQAGLQVAIHAIGDRANDEILRMFEADRAPRAKRFRIEHAQHLSEPIVKRFAASGIIASMQPYHAIDDGRWAERKIGRERSRWTYPFRSLLDAGAILTFGSDWTVAPLSPILGIHAAVTRRTIDGKNPGGWFPEQKITVEEALESYTARNAYAMFLEKEIGTIAPGFRADLVILSRDLFAIRPEEIEKVEVDATVFDGKVVFERDGAGDAGV